MSASRPRDEYWSADGRCCFVVHARRVMHGGRDYRVSVHGCLYGRDGKLEHTWVEVYRVHARSYERPQGEGRRIARLLRDWWDKKPTFKEGDDPREERKSDVGSEA